MTHFLIDILHPAHVHFFKNFIWEMEKKGHEFMITSRDKDCTLQLLNEYNIHHICLSKQKKGKFNLLIEFIIRLWKLSKIIKKEKPDILLGCMGPTISILSHHMKIPSYVMYENESAKLTNAIAYKFCTKFITPHNFKGNVPKDKHITYKGLQQMAFLHPNYFNARPNKTRRNIMIRTVSHESSHDPRDGWIYDMDMLLHMLDGYGEIIWSKENKELFWKASEFHTILNKCYLVISESPTICAEAACMGIKSIYISKSKRGFIDELDEKYNLVYQCTQDEAQHKIEEIIHAPTKYKEFIKDSTNVTRWMISFFENVANGVVPIK